MEILKNFGIEWTLTLAQIINFLIIFYILKQYLYRPIFNVLKKRQDAIKEGVKKAEESKKELEQALEKEKEIIKEAKETAKEIIQEAHEQAQELSIEADEKAKQMTNRMINDAKIQIDLETKKAEAILSKHVSELSVKLLKKSLSNIISDKEQADIISKAVRELGKKPN